MIDFTKLKEIEIPQFNGGKGTTKAKMFMDENIKIMTSVLKKDCSIGEHMHTTSSEIIYVLSGQAKVILDGVEEIINAGQCHYCPKGSTHEIINNGEEELLMFDVVPNQ